MDNPSQFIDSIVADSVRIKESFFSSSKAEIARAAGVIAASLRSGGKILLFGNGGSAADAQHIAAEFVGRFLPDRSPLPAISLATDTSAITAIGNDYGYEQVFARQVEAHGRRGDIAIAISTSGNSPSVLGAIDSARSKELFTIGLTGASGGGMLDRVDILFRIPSSATPRIQEIHILLGHIICELVDRELFSEAYVKD